jgi:hypothetical protein
MNRNDFNTYVIYFVSFDLMKHLISYDISINLIKLVKYHRYAWFILKFRVTADIIPPVTLKHEFVWEMCL